MDLGHIERWNTNQSTHSSTFRVGHDIGNPQALGLVHALYHDTRSKKHDTHTEGTDPLCPILPYYASWDCRCQRCCEEHQTLQMTLCSTTPEEGVLCFAADSTYLASEDTHDRKGSTHRTITSIYQKVNAPGESKSAPLHIVDTNHLSVNP